MPLDSTSAGPHDGSSSGLTTTVVLHGRLAKIYGRRHRIGVRTAAEAAHALCALHPGFRADFEPEYYKVIRGKVAGGLPLTRDMLNMRIGRAGEIHFVPVAGGSKSGAGKAILGAVIVVASVAAAVATGGTSLAVELPLLGTTTLSLTSIGLFGASLLLAGISAVVSPQPKNQSVDQKASFGLSGPINSVAQGSAIPVVYGRTRVGSVVASFGYEAVAYNGAATTATSGSSPTDFLQYTIFGTGSKGGKGGSSGGATEAPNTLQSDAVIRVIDILSQGPIGGLVDGAKSIFFNGTPLMAADGSYNFLGVSYEVLLGYPDQAPVPGFPSAEVSTQVGVQVRQQQPVIRTVTSTDANAARVTIRIPALVQQNTTNGNLLAGPDLSFKFEVRPIGATAWLPVVIDTLSGQKTTSPYQKSYRFDLPQFGQVTSWDIRMTRITPDSTTANVQNDTYWDIITLISDHKLIYPNIAYVALTITASAFGSQIPTRAYEIDGIVCQVPLNYDPIDHTYATTGPGTSMGSWDGASWKLATTSNNAWCTYNMLANTRYGLGLSDAALTLTRYDLFTISQYCDGRVPTGYNDENGNPTYELRYELDIAITQQDDAYRVLQNMVSSFRGLLYWGAGRVCVVADMPTVPSSVLNQGNVIDGQFQYEGTALKTRHTVARVAWLDPQNSYQTTIEVVEDFDQVVTLGQVTTDIVAYGCTSRGRAHRMGKWLLDTEKTQTDTLTTTVALEHLKCRPGDVARVADPAYAGVRMGGRCALGSTTTQINLDSVFPTSGQLYYTFTVTLPDGTVVDNAVVTGIGLNGPVNGANNIVTLQTPLPLAPAVNASWVLSAAGSGPTSNGLFPVIGRQFKVMALAEPSPGTFTLGAVFHDPNKFARVELGLKFDPTPYSTLNQLLVAPVPPPTNVFARDYIAGVGTTTLVRATVGFTPAMDPRVTGAEARAVGPEQRTMVVTTGNSADFDGLQLGTYVFGVRSTGRDGRTSIWVDSDPVVVDGLSDPPAAVSGFTAIGGALQVQLTWIATSARDLLHYELWRAPAPNNGTHPFPFTAYQPTGTPSANGATLLCTVAATSYTDIGDVLGPDKAWAYWVRPVNTTLVQGAFAGPVRALTTYYLTDNLEQAIRNTAPIANQLLGSAPTAVTTLPANGTDGQLVFLATDQKLYRWDHTANGGAGGWVLYVAMVPDSAGKISVSQISDIQNAQLGQTLTQSQIDQLRSAIAAQSITSDQIVSLVGAKITGALTNATVAAGTIYDVDPVTGHTVVGINTSNLLGTIQATKIVDVDPVSGQTVAGVSATKLLGTVAQNALPAIPTSKLVGNILAGTGATLDLAAAGITGTLSAAHSARLEALNGAILTAQISPLAITTPLINVGAVNVDQLAAGAVTTEKLAVGSPNNAISNSCFYVSADGWQGVLPTPTLGNPGFASATTLSGLGSGYILTPALAAGAYADTYYTTGLSGTGRAFDASVPAVPGQTWEAQICYSASFGSVSCFVIFANSAGTLLSGSSTTGSFPPNGDYSLSNWHTLVARATAPAGTVAVGLIIRSLNTSAATAQCSSFVSRALLGQTVANATQPLPWTPGGVVSIGGGIIQSNAIIARMIVAGNVKTAALDAGAVTAEKLAIGSSTNVIWNTSCILATDGWVQGGALATTLGFNYAGLTLLAEGTGYVHGTGTLQANQSIYVYWSPTPGTIGVPCEPGTWVEGQIRGAAHRCALYVYIQFFDSTGTYLSTIGSSRYAGLGGGPTLAGYHLAWVKGVVPSGAATMRLVAVGINDGGTDYAYVGAAPNAANQEPYLFFTRAALGSSTPVPMAISTPQPWAPGGITTISGGVLQTGTVLARAMAAASITTDKLAVGTSNNVIWNSCCTGSTDGWLLQQTGSNGALQFVDATSTRYLRSYGTGALYCYTTLPAGGIIRAAWCPDGSAVGVPCQGGTTWEAQALICAAGCTGQIALECFDPAGNYLSTFTTASSTTNGANDQGAATQISNYQLLTLIATVPANCAFLKLDINLVNTLTTGAQVYFTQTLLAQTVPNATQVSSWSPGGATQISGGAIRTNSIFSRSIAANQITANQLAVGNSNNLIWNSCLAVATDGWTTYPSAGATVVNFGPAASLYPQYAISDGCGALSTVLQAGAVIDVAWQSISCLPGETLEAQAMLLPVGSNAQLYINYTSAAGVTVASSAFSNLVSSQPVPDASLNNTLASFRQVSLISVVPANAYQAILAIRFQSPQASQANGFAIFTHTLLGKTVTGATQVSTWAPGGITTLSGGILQTNSVVTRTIAAGAVTADKVTVAGSSNVIGNPTLPSTSWGWVFVSSCPGTVSGSVTGDAITSAQYALPGEGSGGIRATTMATNQSMYAYWDPDSVGGVPCVPGEWWEMQAYLAAHRCVGTVQLQFFDGANTLLANATGGRVTVLGGGGLSTYGFSWTKLQAPANAAFVRAHAVAFNDGGADIVGGTVGISPYLFFTRMVLGRSNPLSIAAGAQPQPYQIGGVTQVSGGQIKTGAITARALSAASVTANALAVTSATNVIYNGCCAPNPVGWAGNPITVQSEAIGAGLAGYGTGYIFGAIASGQFSDVWWRPNGPLASVPYDASITASPGDLWEAQAKVQTHRCSVQIYLIFTGPAANGVSTIMASPRSTATSVTPPADRSAASSYQLISLKAVAPAGTTAVTVMLRAANDATAQAVFGSAAGTSAYLFFTQVQLAQTLPNAATLTWAPGGITSINGAVVQTGTILAAQIGAAQVTAGALAAGSVTTGALAASAVTAEKAAFGSTNNLIWNSCPDQGAEGWNRYTGGPYMPPFGDATIAMGPASQLNANLNLTGFGSGMAQYLGPATNKVYSSQYFIWDWWPNGGPLPAGTGQRFGASALLCSGNDCSAYVQILFLDYNRNPVGGTVSSPVVTNNYNGQNALIVDFYTRVSCYADAPAGTAFVLFRIAGSGQPAGSIQPFFTFSKAQLSVMAPGSTVVGDWTPGGVTTIDGGMLKTGTLNANRIVSGSITSGQVNTPELTAALVTATSIKSQLVATNKLTAGQIDADNLVVGGVKAGAIGADQIAANQLHAYHLASDFALISAAQIGVATVGSAQIQDLTVNGEKITPGAVTTVGSGSSNPQGTPSASSWSVVLGIYIEKRAGSSGVVLFVKSINTYFTARALDGSGGSGGGEGGGDGDGGE